MLTVKELKPRTFEIALSCVVEASDIGTMKRDLTPALEAGGKMGLMLGIEDLDDVTGDALIADTRFEVSMIAFRGATWIAVALVMVVFGATANATGAVAQ